jgi:hypothetical protein
MANTSKFQARVAADIVQVFQGAAAQTGNLLEFRDSAGNLLASVDANGNWVAGAFQPSTDYLQNSSPKVGPRDPLPSVTGDAGAPGSDTAPARIDHIHDRQGDAALYWMQVKP